MTSPRADGGPQCRNRTRPAPDVSSSPPPRVPRPPPRFRRSTLDRPCEPESTATSSSAHLTRRRPPRRSGSPPTTWDVLSVSGTSENAAIFGVNTDVGAGVRGEHAGVGEAAGGTGVLGVAPHGTGVEGSARAWGSPATARRGPGSSVRSRYRAMGSTAIAWPRPGSACARVRKRASHWSSTARRGSAEAAG